MFNSFEDNELQRESTERKYLEALNVLNEEGMLLREIEHILENSPSRAEGEKKVLQDVAPLIEKAQQRFNEVFGEWLESVKARMKD